MNFYAVLSIPQDADDEAIRRAYRSLVRRYHPDQGLGSSAEKFRQVREAYETLIDPASRRSYDFSLASRVHRAPVRTEPIVVQSGLFYTEDPGVFGRLAPQIGSAEFQNSAGFKHLFAARFGSIGEFFDSDWFW